MKVKVIEAYADKYTGKKMEVGDTATYNDERAEELIYRGFVEEVVPKKAKKKPEEKQ